MTLTSPVIVAQVVKSLMDSYVIPSITDTTNLLKNKFKANVKTLQENFEDYLKRSYERLCVMNTLAFKNCQLRLHDIYQPLTIENRQENQPSLKINKFPDELFEKYRKILIVDTAGMGKSTLMKYLFVEAIDNGYGIPFFLELRKLSKKHGILDEIVQELGGIKGDFDLDFLMELFKRPKFIFIFDGFDEISISNRDAVVEDIKKFTNCLNDNRFILTSRQETMLATFGDFQFFNIVPLKENEAYDLLKKYDKDGELSNNLIKELKSHKDRSIKEFLKNPLLVTLLFIVYNHKAQIPLKKHLFYRQVYEALFENHDLTKGGSSVHEKRSGLDIDDFEKILRHIGFQSFKNGKLEFSHDELIEYISSAKNFWSGLAFKESCFLDDLISAVPLFCQEGLYYRWTHKSLSEYFAAKFIYCDLRNKQQEQLKRMAKSEFIEKYLNLLDLYHDLDPSNFEEAILLPLLKEYSTYLSQFDPKDSDYFLRNLLFSRRLQVYFADSQNINDTFERCVEQPHTIIVCIPFCKDGKGIIVKDISSRQDVGRLMILNLLKSKKHAYIETYRPSQYKFSIISSLPNETWYDIEELIKTFRDNLDCMGELCDLVVHTGSSRINFIKAQNIQNEISRIENDIQIKNTDIRKH